MKISFVIPAYNEEGYIGNCLDSIVRAVSVASPRAESEIIVINNASTDRTGEIAKGFPGVRVVDEPIKGQVYARQRGFEEAEGDIIAYLDADTLVSAEWVPTMLELMARNPHTVAVSGPYLYYDFPFFIRSVARIVESTLGGIAHVLTGNCVAGGNFAVQRVALARIGGFDTSVEFYSSVDAAQRLKKIGKIVYSNSLALKASARRFNAEGLFKTLLFFTLNFLSVSVRGRPVDIAHRDIR